MGDHMAFWSSKTLESRGADLIAPFRPGRIKHGAYELSVGAQAYITSEDKKSKVEADSPITIPPGQFGLLITKEVVSVPRDAIAFISIRAGTKFRGLVNVSGFHVDPGYSDRLMFSVYNAGSRPITLEYDRPVFLIWYADLDQEERDPYPRRTGPLKGISGDDMMKIQGEVASPAELKKLFDELRNETDKRFHEIDMAKQFNRGLIMLFIGLLVSATTFAVIKPMFEAPASKEDMRAPKQELPAPQGAEREPDKKAPAPMPGDKKGPAAK